MVNKVQFIGRLTRDAEVKNVGSTTVTNFALALDEGYKDKSGEWVNKAIFVECQIWNGQGVTLSERVKKGDLVYVEGKYDPNSWETEDGEKRLTPRFTIYGWKSLTFGKKKEVEDGVSEKPAKRGRPAKSEKKVETPAPTEDEGEEVDDIPF